MLLYKYGFLLNKMKYFLIKNQAIKPILNLLTIAFSIVKKCTQYP